MATIEDMVETSPPEEIRASAAIFLPTAFITGLFRMNVGGLRGSSTSPLFS
jgi:hypothetical protein